MIARLLIACMVVVGLSSCTNAPIAPETASSIRRVGIINLVPENITLSRIGLTVFNNKQVTMDLEGRVGQTIEHAISSRLSRARPSWMIVPVSIDKPALMAGIYQRTMVIAYGVERIRPQLIHVAQLNNLDAMIVVSNNSYGSVPGRGVGVWMRTMNDEVSNALVHGHIVIVIVRSDGSVLAAAQDGAPDMLNAKASDLGLDYELNHLPSGAYASRLKDDVAHTVTKAVNRRLDQLGL